MEAKSTRAQFGGVKINRFEPKKNKEKKVTKGELIYDEEPRCKAKDQGKVLLKDSNWFQMSPNLVPRDLDPLGPHLKSGLKLLSTLQFYDGSR